jgi:uncharacterized iron-regulated membrane protein
MVFGFLVSAHRWLSLALGLPIAIVALTGLPLTFWDETDALTAPGFYPARAHHALLIELEGAVALVRQEYPALPVLFVFVPHFGSAIHVSLGLHDGKHVEVAVDRARSEVVGMRNHGASPVGRIYDFHVSFFAGAAGRWIMLGLAWALLVSTLSGTWIWFTRRRPANQRRVPRRRRLTLYVFHNTSGIWAAVVLLMIAGTTIVLTWPSSQPSGHGQHLAGTAPAASLDTYAGIAMATSPGSRVRSISRIDDPSASIRVILEDSWGVPREILIDKHSGRVDSNLPVSATSRSALMRSLHSGDAAGHVGRWIMAAASLLPMLLWLSGAWMWLRRSRARAYR